MKRVKRGGVQMLVFAALAAACHDPRQTQRVPALATIDESELDFGAVPVGEWRESLVHVHNVGNVPFDALDALALTGNPSFVVLFDGGKVPPGGGQEVRVRFHPLQEGPLTDRLRLVTDADQGREGTVGLKGLGTPAPISISPSSLDFQTLEVDSQRVLQVTITNPVDIPLSVASAGLQATQFSPDVLTVGPFSTRVVSIQYGPHVLGASQARIEVRACASCSSTGVGMTGSAVASAFAFSPAPVPFAPVPVHQSARSTTQATNITWRPVQLIQLGTSDPSFVPLSEVGAQWVQPNQTVPLNVRFDSRASGPSVGTLSVNYLSDKARHSEVLLDARGGRPQVSVTPVYIDFGDLPVGGKLARKVRLTNAGTQGNLDFQGVGASGDVSHFGISQPQRGTLTYPWSTGSAWPTLSTPDLAVAPGTDALDFQVYFEPEAPGQFTATLAFATDDPFNSRQPVVVTGHAHASGPCTFRLSPVNGVDFGDVPAGWGAVLGFRFENVGTTECAVKDIHLGKDSGGVFFMPGGPLVGGVLAPTDAFSAQIAFRSSQPGAYSGELDITVNNPSTPVARLPLSAWSYASCLTAAPNFLDFGAIRTDCSPRPLTTYVSNQCATPVTVGTVAIGEGTSDQFSLVSQPSLPLTLQPAAGFELEVAYARNVLGQHFSPLFITASGEQQPFLVPLLGETNHDGFETEDFVQGTQNQLDVLFVVSNTTTMSAYQQRLASAMPGWMAQATQQGLDLHVGVTTTGLVPKSPLCPGGANGGEAGRLFPADGATRRFTVTTTPADGATVSSNLQVGTCHDLVQGLETMRAALSPPLINNADDPRQAQQPNTEGNLGLTRNEARMAVVFLSDEDDHSGFDPQSYVQFLQTLKGPGMQQRTSAWGIVPTDPNCITAGAPGPRFSTVAQQTGGQTLSICSQDYSPLLDQIVTRAGALQRSFQLKATPTDPAAIGVTVDGQPSPSGAWSFDAAANAIVFSASATPQPGQNIQVHYEATCPTTG